jgi:hypothetical protein
VKGYGHDDFKPQGTRRSSCISWQLRSGSKRGIRGMERSCFQQSESVNFHGKSVSGRTIFYGTCNTDLKPGLGVTFEPYSGNALDNIDDVIRPVIFVVKSYDGATREFPAIMHYYEPEKAWVLNNLLPVAFMDEFGRGDLLTIRNARGTRSLISI